MYTTLNPLRFGAVDIGASAGDVAKEVEFLKLLNLLSNVPLPLPMGKVIEMPRDYRTLQNAIEEVYALRWQKPDLSDRLRQRQRNSYVY